MLQQQKFRVPKTLFGLGGVAMFIGIGGAFSGAPLLGVLIGLLLGGALMAVAAWIGNNTLRGVRYRVTRPFDPTATAALWGGLVALIAVAWLIGSVLHTRGGLVVLVAWPFIGAWYQKRRTALQVDASGVSVGGTPIPWADLAQLVVAEPKPGQDVRLGALLRSGRSDAKIQVVVEGGKFDLAQLAAMVRRYGPPDVRLMVV